MVRIMRAYHGHLATTQASTTFSSPGPSMPTMASTMTSPGKESITSHSRMRQDSTRPRTRLASMPSRAPSETVAPMASSETPSVARAP